MQEYSFLCFLYLSLFVKYLYSICAYFLQVAILIFIDADRFATLSGLVFNLDKVRFLTGLLPIFVKLQYVTHSWGMLLK